MMRLLSILLCLAAWCAPALRATPVVSLLTVDAGREVYELEGHTELRIRDDAGRDYCVNWGVFDFNSPNFALRFAAGETDYLCIGFPTDMVVAEYVAMGRNVREQVLALDSIQTERLIALVAENMMPQNRVYRYNYVKDNCALRPLTLIERAIGDTLTFRAPEHFRYGYSGKTQGATPEPATFRSEMSLYHSAYPWYQFGIDLALGSGIDYPITTRERAYSPLYLHDVLAGANVNGRPLVSRESVLVTGTPGGVSQPPTPWPLTPVAVSLYLLAATLAVSVRDLRRRSVSRWFDAPFYFLLFAGGCILTYLIFVSTHEATSPNWLYLWLNPLCIIPVIFEWIKSGKRVVYCYQFCNFAALILLLAGHTWLGQALNTAFLILIACDLIRSFIYIYIYRKESGD